MRKLTIFKYIRSDRDYNKIIGKLTLRVVNVTDSFIGIGDKGQINKAEFRKLAEELEPSCEGISLS